MLDLVDVNVIEEYDSADLVNVEFLNERGEGGGNLFIFIFLF